MLTAKNWDQLRYPTLAIEYWLPLPFTSVRNTDTDRQTDRQAQCVPCSVHVDSITCTPVTTKLRNEENYQLIYHYQSGK